MRETTKRLLIIQGYENELVCTCRNISGLVRWTPLACAVMGTMGLCLKNPFYFLALGLATSIGGLTSRSFYDYIYNYTLRFLLRTDKTPLHGNQRRFGCTIGAVLYISGGIGFLTRIAWLAYAPTVFMIALAYTAAVTQWCFASSLYNLIFLQRPLPKEMTHQR